MLKNTKNLAKAAKHVRRKKRSDKQKCDRGIKINKVRAENQYFSEECSKAPKVDKNDENVNLPGERDAKPIVIKDLNINEENQKVGDIEKLEENKKEKEEEEEKRGICYLCQQDCNPLSQACGSCMRNMTMFGLGYFNEEIDSYLNNLKH